jgi:hypothetical protein
MLVAAGIAQGFLFEEKFCKYPEAPLAHLFVDAAGKSSR